MKSYDTSFIAREKAEILRLLPIDTLLQQFGLTPRHGFIRCPFHKDDTASCRIYPHTDTFYCFGCGKGGNVIDFAMNWYQLGFMPAMQRLNDDFQLGVIPSDHKRTLRDKITADLAIKEAERKRKERDGIRAAANDECYRALTRWLYYQDITKVYAPKTPDEELHPLFVDALMHLDQAEFDLEVAESEVIALATG